MGETSTSSVKRWLVANRGLISVTVILLSALAIAVIVNRDKASDSSTAVIVVPSSDKTSQADSYGSVSVKATGSFRVNSKSADVERECGEIRPLDAYRERSDGTTGRDVLRVEVRGSTLCIVAGHRVKVHGIEIEAVSLLPQRVCLPESSDLPPGVTVIDVPVNRCPELAEIRLSRPDFGWLDLVVLIGSLIVGAAVSHMVERMVPRPRRDTKAAPMQKTG
ncbi:hypothetical protein [Catenuloplanes atrovinosus]|uniref:Uncharacterized protein n=1 Tax=Catenuloplanes atrovinosus TaxID=137266 RepID=A0AAE3YR19_9ACTN|nr:hypothetical protein [Catenuloplanes atrovinosus]MDR7277120.1 hypothetical protein [Catenuloplanes atrovinosus]